MMKKRPQRKLGNLIRNTQTILKLKLKESAFLKTRKNCSMS